jgi:uracil-DNA glycosylase
VRAVVALGRIAFDAAVAALRETGRAPAGRKPAFGHAAEHELADGLTLVGSFHPSQQNTFTGRLTEEMLDDVFARARAAIGRQSPAVSGPSETRRT